MIYLKDSKKIKKDKEIIKIKYDAKNKTLKIKYNSGKIFLFREVPYVIYKSLININTRNLYLETHIKNNFPCIKIS